MEILDTAMLAPKAKNINHLPKIGAVTHVLSAISSRSRLQEEFTEG
jgi:hypothetical protein